MSGLAPHQLAINDKRRTNLPGFSGISTLSKTSRPSPSSARSATNRNREKFMLAPLTTATNRFPAPISWLSMMYRFSPATARAPDGSVMDLVSDLGIMLIRE